MVHTARRGTIWLTLLAAAAGARPAEAQNAVTVGGVVYAQYAYQTTDTAHGNQFDVTRAYLNVIGRFDGGIVTRVTGDVYRTGDGSLAYRLKYAHFAWTPKNSPLTYKFGQLQTSWVDWEETLWDYRMQGTVAVDRNGYMSSADFGIAADANFNHEQVDAQAALVNGTNYNKAPGDRHKTVMGRVSVRLAATDDASRVGGLRLSAYGQYGPPPGGGVRNRLLGMLSYRSRMLTLAAGGGLLEDSTFSTAPANVKPDVKNWIVSTYGTLKPPNSPIGLIARVDVLNPNRSVAGRKQTRVIGGVSYQLKPHVRLLADWDHLSYQGGAPTPAAEAARSQLLFQSQINF